MKRKRIYSACVTRCLRSARSTAINVQLKA